MYKFIFSLALVLSTSSWAAESHRELIENICSQELEIYLEDPVFKDGVLLTKDGGRLAGKGVYLQADKIEYLKKDETGAKAEILKASGNILFIYHDHVMTGDSIEYNFLSEFGTVTNGVMFNDPWFVGGETIELHPEGQVRIIDAYATMGSQREDSWEMQSRLLDFIGNDIVHAQDVTFQFIKIPFFWLPSARITSNGFLDSLSYRLRLNGLQGTSLTVSYPLYESEIFRAKSYISYNFKRGPGFGLDTRLQDRNKQRQFKTTNYFAKDISRTDKDRTNRYRFYGRYKDQLTHPCFHLEATYDRVSDSDLASDYEFLSIDHHYTEKTRAAIYYANPWSKARLQSTLRINDFETIKQELPSLTWNVYPIPIGPTSLLFQNRARIEYLDQQFASTAINASDFHSSRIILQPELFYPIQSCGFTITPSIGANIRHYSNSPMDGSKGAAQGIAKLDLSTRFIGTHGDVSHLMEPYINYTFSTPTNSSPDERYVFDYLDGFSRDHSLTYGLRNSWNNSSKPCQTNWVTAHIYAHQFINKNDDLQSIPWIFGKFSWKSSLSTLQKLHTGWDIDRSKLLFLNARSEATLSRDLAIAGEFRTRSPHYWRKLNHRNYTLETYRSTTDLLSSLSDHRNIFLLDLFYRLNSFVNIQLSARSGRDKNSFDLHNNPKSRTYFTEYSIAINTLLKEFIELKFVFARSEQDSRFGLSLRLNSEAKKQNCFVRKEKIEYNNPYN